MKYFFLTTVLAFVFVVSVSAQQSDAALRRITAEDRAGRDASGKLVNLAPGEHLSRAETYSSNRLFPQAREHWQKVLDNYPGDGGVAKALFGIARSYMWERQYDKAVAGFDKLLATHADTKEGREGLAFKGASLVRLGKDLDAARVYEQYVTMYPAGERIETAHTNIIDAYREAEKYDLANSWVDRTVARFATKPAAANALHARLRMEIHRENWVSAIAAADRLLERGNFAGSMSGADEVKFLKAFALERHGRKPEAAAAYASVNPESYFGSLVENKLGRSSVLAGKTTADYPVPYRTELLQAAAKYKVDPRFLLAIMKQESSFKAAAKSPAGARGLLQLVFDTAIKYNKKAGYPNFQPDDLYKPAVNIAVGSAYIADLRSEFGGMYEAIAASYNGGEDNAARWLKRSRPAEPGIFASEVGFAESKNYVFKVMNNYRVYRQLYNEKLERK